MGVSAAVTMDTGMFIFCACADAHIHCCLSIKWVDQGVVYPIRLSGLFSYPAWLRNKGVRIIEVLLYSRTVPNKIISLMILIHVAFTAKFDKKNLYFLLPLIPLNLYPCCLFISIVNILTRQLVHFNSLQVS